MSLLSLTSHSPQINMYSLWIFYLIKVSVSTQWATGIAINFSFYGPWSTYWPQNLLLKSFVSKILPLVIFIYLWYFRQIQWQNLHLSQMFNMNVTNILIYYFKGSWCFIYFSDLQNTSVCIVITCFFKYILPVSESEIRK